MLGILFIVGGVLIALYPPLLSIIVATMMIFLGISFMVVGYYYRKMAKKVENPYVDFFIRF